MKKAGEDMPFLSVVIPAFNSEKYLADAVVHIER